MILLTLMLAFAAGVAITYWIITPIQHAVWRRADRRRAAKRLAQQERRLEAIQRADAAEDRRLLGELRRICEPTR